MLVAAVEHIGQRLPGACFTLLSLYPREDARENELPALRLVSWKPAEIVLRFFPAAVGAGLAKRFGLPWPTWLLPASARAVAEADLVVDLSGICFVDGRSAGTLLYNAITALSPWLLGTPSCKYAQAMGPFGRPVNRLAARFCLPRVSRIIARGRVTEEHLVKMGLERDRVFRCADAAFAMRVSPSAEREAARLAEHLAFSRPLVVVAPSSVVDAHFRKQGRDYVGLMSEFIDWLVRERGYGVLLLSHSTRPWTESRKDNDLPLCREILARVAEKAWCCFPDGAHHADVLRALIGKGRFLVASRFHAMVSGLAMGVPSLLIGWSHKYQEVLEDFQLEAYSLDYVEVDSQRLRARFTELTEREREIREQVASHLPGVVRASEANASVAVELLGVAS